MEKIEPIEEMYQLYREVREACKNLHTEADVEEYLQSVYAELQKFEDTPKVPRKIVNIAIHSAPRDDIDRRLFALCDDGTVWHCNPDEMKTPWYRVRDIPQD